ncbi:hypothetical protein RR48_11641 [Papilio machaon]|uniref:Uncharacterized protein n=1 Tax=Papilio machaon TaxID=76193 RepID=A0A194R568_PAPMA|nr:hypothetical protein RR48_11641 [Papilio machaon]
MLDKKPRKRFCYDLFSKRYDGEVHNLTILECSTRFTITVAEVASKTDVGCSAGGVDARHPRPPRPPAPSRPSGRRTPRDKHFIDITALQFVPSILILAKF